MGFFSKVTNVVKKAYDGTIGDIINPSNYLTRQVTGLSNTGQAGVGLAGAGAVGLLGNLGLLSAGGLSAGDVAGDASSGGFVSGLLGSLGSGLVKGVVGLGTDYLNSQWQYSNDMKALERQNEYNLAMADKTFGQNQALAEQDYQRNLDMWNLQNQYNSPTMQMARLRAAGLNPNLVYGGGNVSGLTTSDAPQMQSAQYSAPQSASVPSKKALAFDRFFDAMSKYQQLENQHLTNEFTRQRIALAERDSDRADRLADAQINNMAHMYGLRGAELSLDTRKQQFAENSPKSWIGRNYNDIKDVASDVVNDVSGYAHKFTGYLSDKLPKPDFRGMFRRNKYPWEK